MPDEARARAVPVYRGLERIGGALPDDTERWPKFSTRAVVAASGDDYDASLEDLREYAAGKPWVWPRRPIYFFTDVHADADALVRCLVASGGVAKTGPEALDFELTEEGKQADFIFGGDYLDKGPANLPLLDALAHLAARGARVDVLAGNHDVRALLGLAYLGRTEPHLAHLFVRMGKKSIRLFREAWDRWLEGNLSPRSLSSDGEVRARYFPAESWYEQFPTIMAGRIPAKKLEKEIQRIREKIGEFQNECEQWDMSLGMVLAAAQKCREVFVESGGLYRWLYDRMTLARREGSVLFVHAGVCDVTAAILLDEGVDALNRRFRSMLRDELFDLYHGPLGNMFRTKYREIDYPLTERGVTDLHRAGVYAIVHGHMPVRRGQRLVLRQGLLNFECDASVDRNTRALAGLTGLGGAATIFRRDGTIIAVSTDYRYAKVLDSATMTRLITVVGDDPDRLAAAAG